MESPSFQLKVPKHIAFETKALLSSYKAYKLRKALANVVVKKDALAADEATVREKTRYISAFMVMSFPV